MDINNFISKLLQGKTSKDNVLDQLYKQPPKDINGDNTVFTRTSPNYFQYLDLLYLPNDKGFIYCLVITDQGSRLVDCEPLKDRKSSDIVKALETIYKRKILLKPKVIITDSGSEFKKDFSTALQKQGIQHKIIKAGRHRSVALVERKNQTIGKIIHKLILQVEINSGIPSSQWTSYIKNLVSLINIEVKKREKQKPNIPIEKQSFTYNPDKPIKMLNVGDKVRVSLDNPQDINGNPLIGRFRKSDIRFNPKIRTVKYVLMEPEEPIMYLLDGNIGPLKIESVGYTYNQLQKVSATEQNTVQPVLNEDINRFEFKKIWERRKSGRTYEYLVQWKNYPKNQSTWEKRKPLVEDLGENFMKKIDNLFDKQTPV
jgi:hypothetical protein